MPVTLDEVFTEGDAVVELMEDGTHTFVAANPVGREATLRAIEKNHPDKHGLIHIAWRDAGEGWPDTWLGFSFPFAQDRPMAAAIAAQGARVFHQSEGGAMTYLATSARDELHKVPGRRRRSSLRGPAIFGFRAHPAGAVEMKGPRRQMAHEGQGSEDALPERR